MPTHGKLYLFVEGALTVTQFRLAHTPCLSESTIRKHLARGRNSAQAMLCWAPDAAQCGRLAKRR